MQPRFTVNEPRYCHDFLEGDSEPARCLANWRRSATFRKARTRYRGRKFPATEPGIRLGRHGIMLNCIHPGTTRTECTQRAATYHDGGLERSLPAGGGEPGTTPDMLTGNLMRRAAPQSVSSISDARSSLVSGACMGGFNDDTVEARR